VVNLLDKKARHSARDKLTVVVMDKASIHRHIDPDVLRTRQDLVKGVQDLWAASALNINSVTHDYL
jgi:hypothetical protein